MFAIAGLAIIGLVSCGGSGGGGDAGGKAAGGDPEQAGTLTVFGASSLTDAFGELSKTFEKDNPGVKVKSSFAASSALLTQIQQGAPADVFASADEAKIRTAVDDGLVEGKPQIFVRNRLVIITPKGNPAGIESYRDLSNRGIKLVLAQDEVPVAEYAKESLGKADKEFGDGFKKEVFSNIVSREADVRASVNRVAVGDADATISYTSDVTPDVRDKVKTVEIPQKLNVVATYPIAVLKESESKELARKWVDFVISGEGQRVLKKWGFEPAA